MNTLHSVELTPTKTFEIWQDGDSLNPREDYDNLGTIWHCVDRYVLGDEKHSQKEIIKKQKEVIKNGGIALPVYCLQHGSISLSLEQFSCPWDSGQSGIIFATKDKILSEFNDFETDEIKEKIKNIFASELEIYTQFLNGEVHGFSVIDFEVCNLNHKHEKDSHHVGGFFGSEWENNGILEELTDEEKSKVLDAIK